LTYNSESEENIQGLITVLQFGTKQ